MNCRLKAAGLPRCKDVGSKKSSQPGGPRGPADPKARHVSPFHFLKSFKCHLFVNANKKIGALDWIARNYFIPGGTPKGACSGAGVMCCTLSDHLRGQG